MRLKCLLMMTLLALSCVACNDAPPLSTLEGKLPTEGITAYEVGDQILVVLSTDHLFDLAHPDQINPAMYAEITNLAKIILHDHPVKVEIFAYANRNGLSDESLALTKRQASTLAAYLWSQGVARQTMVYRGYGQAHPVAKTRSLGSDLVNNRIEVRWWLPTSA
jgi:outer membrane protein OmpA-like peptidoglycan-associated protein